MAGAGVIALRSERVVSADGVGAAAVCVAGARIAAIATDRGAGRAEVLELGDRWVVPGFIDTHVHGGGGAQLHTTDLDELLAATRFHAAHGTTGLLATTVSAPVDGLTAVLRGLGAAAHDGAIAKAGGAALLGVHLEGPFLSPARPGAMDPATFTAADRELARRLLAAAQGAVRMVTVAPELPGALQLIGDLTRAGAVVSLGHTDATHEQMRAGVQAGARSVTHLFNAMRGFHHREAGAAGAALELDAVNVELIADGAHVSAPAARVALRAKGVEGVRLITDAVAAAGMPDGIYRLAGAAIESREGRATLSGTDTLAGSVLTMDAAVRWAVAELGISVPEAVALAAANPARLLGLDRRKGRLAAGMDADLVVLDAELRVCATMVGGAWALPPSW